MPDGQGRSPQQFTVGGLPFTDAARQLLADARIESDKLYHEYIGTEHLLLALTRQTGVDAILARLSVDAMRVRAMIESTVIPGRALPSPPKERPLTSRTQKSLNLAADTARALKHSAIAVEHLVVGMLREQHGIAAQVLADHGLTVEHALALANRLGRDGATT